MRLPPAVAPSAFVAASLANMPIVYLLVEAHDPGRGLALPILGVGLLAVGLAFAAASHIEGRRRPFALAMAALGAVEVALVAAVTRWAPLPPLDGAAVAMALAAAGVASVCGVVALVGLLRAPYPEPVA